MRSFTFDIHLIASLEIKSTDGNAIRRELEQIEGSPIVLQIGNRVYEGLASLTDRPVMAQVDGIDTVEERRRYRG